MTKRFFTDCHSGSDFGIEILDGSKARVYRAETNVLFSRKKVRIYTYPNTDSVKILVKDAIIILKGLRKRNWNII